MAATSDADSVSEATAIVAEPQPAAPSNAGTIASSAPADSSTAAPSSVPPIVPPVAVHDAGTVEPSGDTSIADASPSVDDADAGAADDAGAEFTEHDAATAEEPDAGSASSDVEAPPADVCRPYDSPRWGAIISDCCERPGAQRLRCGVEGCVCEGAGVTYAGDSCAPSDEAMTVTGSQQVTC